MTVRFDRCIKTEDSPTIWMVKGDQRVKFETWEEYVAAGRPPFEIVAREELRQYRAVKRFTTPRHTKS